jgi:glycosyltransferase involved in cell wall biosynthesis
VKIPQIAVIHDGNFRYLYPHLNAVAQSLRGVACVHGSAYGSARMFDGKYAFIPNPHPLVPLTKDWEEKKKIVVCAHMWKAWKHMEYAVHAAPHLKSSRLLLGGDGIERRYMTSPTKCKDKYLGIWRNMMDSGKAKYLDILPNPKLMEIYDRSRVMFDPSFSKNYNKLGSHFNRSLFESYNHGVVPVAIESNMQLPGIFKEGVTHIGLPDTLNPKQIAATLDRAVNLSSVEAGRIVSAGRKLIKERFRAKVVAQNLLDLAEGKDCGLTDRLTKGEPTKEMVAAMENILQGGPPRSRVPDAAPSKRSGRALF